MEDSELLGFLIFIGVSLTLFIIIMTTWMVITSLEIDNPHPKNPKPNLAYTDSEFYLIETLIHHKGKMLTIKEIGCSQITMDVFILKQKRVKMGILPNKNHLPTFDIIISKEENGITRYGIRK